MKPFFTALIATLTMFCIVPPSLTAKDEVPKIPIWVKAATNADGFTVLGNSTGRQDSIRDIIGHVKKSKMLILAQTEQDSLVILEVIGRNTRIGYPGVFVSNISRLEVRLIAGEFVMEFGVDTPSGAFTSYNQAAQELVRQVGSWVGENYSLIREHKIIKENEK